MGFTLRFMLGLALVLTACSVSDCASRWRHVRQVSPTKISPEDTTLYNDLSNINLSTKKEDVSNGTSNTVETSNQVSSPGDDERVEIIDTGKKPKTEISTEKSAEDNIINVNKTINYNSGQLGSKTESKNLSSTEVPLTSVYPNDSANENYLTKNPPVEVEHQKESTKNVPELKQDFSVTRAESGRSLDVDISKYVSPEFHNKNNVYTFSEPTDTEKYTNTRHDLTKSITSKFLNHTPKLTTYDSETTIRPGDDFARKFQDIENGVRQKLEYIDHHFSEAKNEFKNMRGNDATNISKILEDVKDNDTTVQLNYTKFKNFVSNSTRDKNKIHKEFDMESGQNIDYSVVYNKTQVLDDPPKDYKNKIPVNEEYPKAEILTEDIPEHNDAKFIKHVDTKPFESDAVNEKIPEIVNFKDSTPISKLPSLNQTENQKSLLSNNIETDVANPAENIRARWEEYPFMSTTELPKITTQPIAQSTSNSTELGQKEEVIPIPYGKDNFINVSKRGYTRYVDTMKTTTPDSTNKSRSVANVTSKTKLTSIDKQILATKENKTREQSVLENQVYSMQFPSLTTEHKNKVTLNDTTEKPTSTEGSTLSLKLYTISHSTKPSILTETTPTVDREETTTETDAVTTTTGLELTTQTTNTPFETTTILNAIEYEETTDSITERMSTKENIETTTILENSTSFSESSTMGSTTTLAPSTINIESYTTNDDVEKEKFTTIPYQRSTTELSEERITSTQPLFSTEMPSLDENYTTSNFEYVEYLDENATTSAYGENDTLTTVTTSDYLESNGRASSGRDLKDNSDPNNTHILEYTTSATVWDFNISTTEKPLPLSNTTGINDVEVKTTIELQATTENNLNNYNDTINKKILLTSNITELPKRCDYEREDNNDTIENDPRTSVHMEETTSETTPFIVPLNISMVETDVTDSTTISDNLQFGSDEKGEGSGGPIAAIVISCIGAACLVILAGLLFVMRKRHKRFNYGQRCTPVSLDAYSVDNVSVYNSVRRKGAIRASKRSYGNPAFDDPSSISHSLNFPGLAKFANNLEGIRAEFEEIPQVTAQMNELPEGCETKNRYANVIPLPETRVYLNAIDGYPNSDYINANYVTGPKSTRGYYIACQAPMQNTVDDFWRMVWEQQSKVILMLAHLFENGTEKCADYLPPSEVLDCHRLFGDFQVTLKKREVKEKYVISSLQLKNMVSNSWREVTHLWYLGWPEKGVPTEANSLIAFLIEARSYRKAAPTAENGMPKSIGTDQVGNGIVNLEQCPVTVHCSPGTGRTGTVIACDIAIREFELTRQVDIPKTVYRIRRDRASSVQTKEQYAFIYKVICLYATKLTGGVLDSL